MAIFEQKQPVSQNPGRGTLSATLFSLLQLTLWAAPATATAPQNQLLNKPSEQYKSLSYVTIEVNGKRKQLTPGQSLTIVAGDIAKVIDAKLADGTAPPKVNFVGFPNKDPVHPADDRGYAINTGKDLLKSWSTYKKGREYRIDVSSSDQVLATLPVRLIEPELLYVIAHVNGKERVLRPGEVSQIKESDDFEIIKVVSNIADLDPSVRFNMESATVKDRKVYSMNFYRHDRRFGLIQLEIQ